MSLQAPLFHRAHLTPPLTGRQADKILQKGKREYFGTSFFKVAALMALTTLSLVAFKVLMRSMGQTYPALKYTIAIPLFLIGSIPVALFHSYYSPHRLETHLLETHLQKNGALTQPIIRQIAKLFPTQMAQIMLSMNFLQLKEARQALGSERVRALCGAVNNEAISAWRLIDRVLIPKTKTVDSKKQNLQLYPIAAFELDKMIEDNDDDVKLKALRPRLMRFFPELKAKPYGPEGKKAIKIRTAYFNHFAEGKLVKRFRKSNIPEIEGIERYIELINGNEGLFSMAQWLKDVQFCIGHKQKKMLGKLDATLAANYETLTEAEIQQFQTFLKTSVSPHYFAETLTKLYHNRNVEDPAHPGKTIDRFASFLPIIAEHRAAAQQALKTFETTNPNWTDILDDARELHLNLNPPDPQGLKSVIEELDQINTDCRIKAVKINFFCFCAYNPSRVS